MDGTLDPQPLNPQSSMSRKWPYYSGIDFEPPVSPPAGGLRLKSKRGPIVEKWWAEQFLQLVEVGTARADLEPGRRCARAGHVLSIEIGAGFVTSRVQRTESDSYDVRIDVSVFDNDVWSVIYDGLHAKAANVAQLLAGAMPEDIETVFEAAGVCLFPQAPGDAACSCPCEEANNYCRHVLATLYILADRLDDEPVLLFQLRGQTREQMLDALWQAWSVPCTQRPADSKAPERAARNLSAFYRHGADLKVAADRMAEFGSVRNVVKRLGFPPFFPESEQNVSQMLAKLYEDRLNY